MAHGFRSSSPTRPANAGYARDLAESALADTLRTRSKRLINAPICWNSAARSTSVLKHQPAASTVVREYPFQSLQPTEVCLNLLAFARVLILASCCRIISEIAHSARGFAVRLWAIDESSGWDAQGSARRSDLVRGSQQWQKNRAPAGTGARQERQRHNWSPPGVRARCFHGDDQPSCYLASPKLPMGRC